MTDPERGDLADRLLTVVFSLRPDDGEKGKAWVLAMATGVMARAICGSVGPDGNAQDLLELSAERVRTMVDDAQLGAMRERLTRPMPGSRH